MLRAIAFASLVSLAATSASFWDENGGRSVRHHYGDSEGRYGRDSWAGRGHYGGGKDDDDDDDGDSYRKYRQYGGRHGHKDDEDGGDDDRYKWQPSSGGKHSHHKYGKDWESGWDWDDDNKHGRDKESKKGDKDSDVPSSTGHGWKHSYGGKDDDRSKTHYGWDGDNDNEQDDDDDDKKASGDHHGKDSDGKSKHSHRHGEDSKDKSKSDKDSNGDYKHKHDGKDSSGKYGKDRDDWDSDKGKKTERHGKDSDDKPESGKGWDSYGDNGWDSDRGHGDDDWDSGDKHKGKHQDRDDDWNSDEKPKDKEHGRDDDKHHGHEGEKSDDKPKDKDRGRDSDKHKDKDHGRDDDKSKDEGHDRDDEWNSGGKHKDKDQGYGDHGGYDQPDNDHDEPNHGKPTSPEPFAQTLRKDTESFVSDVLSWISDLVGSDAAATLVVDTTFSLTKNGQSTSELRSCGDVDVLKGLFPVIHNSVNHPQDVDLLGQNVQSISWTPGEGCVDDSGNATLETEGGVYASIQITCGAKTLLNVSLASSGSTPTIKSLPVEDSGLYLDVTILEGAITATDAQGSIIGVIKSRHFPENVDSVVKNWTTIVKECAEAQTLQVDGVIGGGWTEYRPDANATGGYQQFVVGYAESFTLAYPPSTETNSVTEPTVVFAAKSGVRGGSSTSPQLISPSLQQIARGVSSGYVTSSLACGQQQSSTGTTGCSSRVVMDELTLFHAVASSTVFVALPQGFHATSGDSNVTTGTVLMGVVVVATFAVIGVAVLTQRRREGYETLVQGK